MFTQQVVTIHPNHPFFGGVDGVFEFMVGEDKEIQVFSQPRTSEDEIKTFFMIRPDDLSNYMRLMSNPISDLFDQALAELGKKKEEDEEEDEPIEFPDAYPEELPDSPTLPDDDHPNLNPWNEPKELDLSTMVTIT